MTFVSTNKPTPIVEVTVETVAFGGAGIAKNNGKVYFVEGVVPGDKAKIEVTQDKKRYAQARVIEITHFSPLRQTAPCRFHGVCGGCLWQDIDAAQQLAWKAQFVQSALQRIAKLDLEKNITLHPAPQSFGYRNRVHLKGVISSSGELLLGYFKRGSRELVAIDRCLIAEEPINDFLQELQTLGPLKNLAPGTFKVELQVVTRDNLKKGVTATFFPDKSMPVGCLDDLLEAIRKGCPSLAWTGYIFNTDQSPYWQFTTTNQGLKQFTRPGLFQQVNRRTNKELQQAVLEIASRLRVHRILDLYAGSGNLSLDLAAKLNAEVIGIEYAKRAVECAEENFLANALSSPRKFYVGDTITQLKRIEAKIGSFDLVIADPPREGMSQALASIIKIAPADILYVSCDPTTLARDLSVLCKNYYDLTSVHLFEMFPHTHHVETLVHLTRVKGMSKGSDIAKD